MGRRTIDFRMGALMGGIVDNPMASATGEKKTVLRGGFLIAPPIGLVVVE